MRNTQASLVALWLLTTGHAALARGNAPSGARSAVASGAASTPSAPGAAPSAATGAASGAAPRPSAPGTPKAPGATTAPAAGATPAPAVPAAPVAPAAGAAPAATGEPTAPAGHPGGRSEMKPPSAAGQVPTEDAAQSYAAPGSADGAEPPGAAGSEPAAPGGPTAATTSTTPKPPGEGDESDPVIPLARDTVGHHLAVGAIGGLAVPFGSIDSNVAAGDLLGAGLFLGGDITYGVSRAVMVGAYGEVAMPSGEGAWSGQHASSIAAGPMIRYHLVQGTSFDPWLSYGIGFRRVSSGTSSFTGLDWARIQLGGDWYAGSRFGLGPLLEVSMGTILDATAPLATKTVNAQFVLGLRVVFDSPGK